MVNLTLYSPSMVKGNIPEAMGIHFGVFLPTMHSQCDSQQKKRNGCL